MTRETLVLVARKEAADAADQHAARLRDRAVADSVHTATYNTEPAHELPELLDTTGSDRTYVVPYRFAHTQETTVDVPRALTRLSGDVRYCRPIGESPVVTDAVRSLAPDRQRPTALLLVALGNSRDSHCSDAAEFHATRLREEFAEVKTAYLLQSPTVECARYTIERDQVVVCPLFVADCEATAHEIPEKLDLDRSGVEYTDPLGTAPAVTDAIETTVEQERSLAVSGVNSVGTDLVERAQPVATDGLGLR